MYLSYLKTELGSIKWAHFNEDVMSTLDGPQKYPFEGSVLYTADRQMGGKGRTEGRFWDSGVGGVYFSFFVRGLSIPYDKPLDLYVLTGDAIIEVIHECIPLIEARLKPSDGSQEHIEGEKLPNDILIEGKKVSGFFVQKSVCGDLVDECEFHIGINVNNSLPEVLRKTSGNLMCFTDQPLQPKTIAKSLCRVIAKKLSDIY